MIPYPQKSEARLLSHTIAALQTEVFPYKEFRRMQVTMIPNPEW